MTQPPRICLLVCDSWGVGGAPDAADYGDEGANTLAHVADAVGGLSVPNLESLGFGAVTSIAGVGRSVKDGTAHGRLVEVSAGKDTTTGHWELSGLRLDRAFPVYPDGFPPQVIGPFEDAVGRRVLGNVAASGTQILDELGAEHLRTGRPIVYTSADSVFQIACHTKVADLETLYSWCRAARGILTGDHAVGRVIARPFDGVPGAFHRRPERRDFSLEPQGSTLLDACAGAGVPVHAVGKISDIFCARGVTSSVYTGSDREGMERTTELMTAPGPQLVFTNLVDFDSKFGHRNDAAGYAGAIEAFDSLLPDLLDATGNGYLFVTGDHGCDPTLAGTDHTREMTPLLVHAGSGPAIDLGTRRGFGSLGATIAEILGVDLRSNSGESFAGQLRGIRS